jgi:hypothetical protein
MVRKADRLTRRDGPNSVKENSTFILECLERWITINTELWNHWLAGDGGVMQHLGETARMGPLLLAEVERQLLADLEHYGVSRPGLKIDWSDACGEGHCTRYLDGNPEELSSIAVVGSNEAAVAEGWFDFVHGGDDYPLYVFWLFLSIHVNDEWKKVKGEPVIPEHVWDRLPDQSKEACCKEGAYDARWSRDPKVIAWRRRLTNG